MDANGFLHHNGVTFGYEMSVFCNVRVANLGCGLWRPPGCVVSGCGRSHPGGLGGG